MHTTITAATATDMRALGAHLANHMHGGEVILLSGPLGAGKTTFAQGFGAGLGIDEPIVSPTFTIPLSAQKKFGTAIPRPFADGSKTKTSA